MLAAAALFGTIFSALAIALPGGMTDAAPDGKDEMTPGDDGDLDDLEDEDEAAGPGGERVVEVDAAAREVSITLRSETVGVKDDVQVLYEAPKGQLTVSFEREGSGEEEVEMRVTFRSVDEVVTDADAPFGFVALQRHPLADLPLVALGQEDFTADNGAIGKKVTATYTLPGTGDGTFGLVFWVFGEFAVVDGVPVRPSEVKVDIHIVDFPFRDGASSVAVNLAVKTELEVEVGGASTLSEIEARGEGFAAFFRWADRTTVDDMDRPVTSVTLRESMQAELEPGEAEFQRKVHLLLVYPQGASIVHDPTVGVEPLASPVPSSGPSPLALASGVASASLLVLGGWAAHRRRG